MLDNARPRNDILLSRISVTVVSLVHPNSRLISSSKIMTFVRPGSITEVFFFVDALENPAPLFFLTHCSSRMPFEQIISIMRLHFNSESWKLNPQSDMDSPNFYTFMKKADLSDYSQGLPKLVDHINALAPQLPQCFGDGAHKTQYLHCAVMQFQWAKASIAQLMTSRYFLRFVDTTVVLLTEIID